MRPGRLIIVAFLLPGLTVAQAEETTPASEGCLVERVQPGSPAEAAGLKVGDVIVAASSVSIRSAEDLRTAVRETAGDLSMTVRRADRTESLTARLKPDRARGYRLGVLCAEESSKRGALTPSDVPVDIYLGPSFRWLSLGGDFDGNRVLFNRLTGKVAAVPAFDDGPGFGGVIGLKSPLPKAPVDIAMELSYEQGSMNNSLAGAANDQKAVLHEVSLTGKAHFLANRSLRPVLGIGMDIPWLKVPDGIISTSFLIEDATFRGIGWHAGGGLCYYISRQVSVEAFFAYYWRRFNSLNGETINNPLLSGSFEPSLSIHYHFSTSKPKEKSGRLQPKV